MRTPPHQKGGSYIIPHIVILSRGNIKILCFFLPHSRHPSPPLCHSERSEESPTPQTPLCPRPLFVILNEVKNLLPRRLPFALAPLLVILSEAESFCREESQKNSRGKFPRLSLFLFRIRFLNYSAFTYFMQFVLVKVALRLLIVETSVTETLVTSVLSSVMVVV